MPLSGPTVLPAGQEPESVPGTMLTEPESASPWS